MFPSIPQRDLKASYLAHKKEIDDAMKAVLSSGRYILGERVRNFERRLASFLGVEFAIGVASGTDALEIALRACGIGPGDAVITVSHTAVATVAAIELVGAKPILIDVDPLTYTMDPDSLELAIKQFKMTQRIKAVIPVHLYGNPADMPKIIQIAEKNKLFVIEDCAQSLGARISNKKTGAWGHLSTFSFYPTKNLGAAGDGGAVATSNIKLAQKVRMLREYGWKTRYISDLPGKNSRLDELQAAILSIKIGYLEKENNLRRKIADLYNSLLLHKGLLTPEVKIGSRHVYHQYVIRSQKRNRLQRYLDSRGIRTLIHYPVPIHLQPAYKNRILVSAGGLSNTEKICKEILSLPVYPELTIGQIKLICHSIAQFYKEML